MHFLISLLSTHKTSIFQTVPSINMIANRFLSLAALLVLAAASPFPADSPAASIGADQRAALEHTYVEAYNAGLKDHPDHAGHPDHPNHPSYQQKSAKAKPPKDKEGQSIKHKCNAQCGKTGAACSAACMANLLGLNVGNLAPCFASCGTASAACHNAVCRYVTRSATCSTVYANHDH